MMAWRRAWAGGVVLVRPAKTATAPSGLVIGNRAPNADTATTAIFTLPPPLLAAAARFPAAHGSRYGVLSVSAVFDRGPRALPRGFNRTGRAAMAPGNGHMA